MIVLALFATAPLINDYRCKLEAVSSTHPITTLWYSEPADPKTPWTVRFSNYEGVTQHVRSGRRQGVQIDKIAWTDRSGNKLTAEFEWSDSFGVSGVASEVKLTNWTKHKALSRRMLSIREPRGT